MKSKRFYRFMLSLVLICSIFINGCKQNSKNNENNEEDNNKIDVGGYSLYKKIAGEGAPTVIFEAGGGNTSEIWRFVQPEIAKITKTFSYDRAGIGKSDQSLLARTALEQVKELRILLEKTDIKPPYIFVASSYGAFVSKLFTALYPNEVSGIVFVDGTSEKMPPYVSENLSFFKLQLLKFVTRNDPDGNTREINISAQQINDAMVKDALRNIPVIVLTSDNKILTEQFGNSPLVIAATQWMKWQSEMVSLSNKSKHFIISGSGHMIHQENPKVVINAITRLIRNDYNWDNKIIEQSQIISLPVEKMRRFVGHYLFSVDNILTIKEENGLFIAEVPYRTKTEILPLSDQNIIFKNLNLKGELILKEETNKEYLIITGAYEIDTIVAERIADTYSTPYENLVNGKIDEAISVYKAIFDADPLNIAISETQLNKIGYNFLNQSKNDAAIAVFNLNTELYPNSSNAFDSLAEAYMLGGNTDLAIKNYEKSLQLNPQNTNAIKQLKKLK